MHAMRHRSTSSLCVLCLAGASGLCMLCLKGAQAARSVRHSTHRSNPQACKRARAPGAGGALTRTKPGSAVGFLFRYRGQPRATTLSSSWLLRTRQNPATCKHLVPAASTACWRSIDARHLHSVGLPRSSERSSPASSRGRRLGCSKEEEE